MDIAEVIGAKRLLHGSRKRLRGMLEEDGDLDKGMEQENSCQQGYRLSVFTVVYTWSTHRLILIKRQGDIHSGGFIASVLMTMTMMALVAATITHHLPSQILLLLLIDQPIHNFESRLYHH